MTIKGLPLLRSQTLGWQERYRKSRNQMNINTKETIRMGRSGTHWSVFKAPDF
jgi:hypothetical protein